MTLMWYHFESSWALDMDRNCFISGVDLVFFDKACPMPRNRLAEVPRNCTSWPNTIFCSCFSSYGHRVPLVKAVEQGLEHGSQSTLLRHRVSSRTAAVSLTEKILNRQAAGTAHWLALHAERPGSIPTSIKQVWWCMTVIPAEGGGRRITSVTSSSATQQLWGQPGLHEAALKKKKNSRKYIIQPSNTVPCKKINKWQHEILHSYPTSTLPAFDSTWCQEERRQTTPTAILRQTLGYTSVVNRVKLPILTSRYFFLLIDHEQISWRKFNVKKKKMCSQSKYPAINYKPKCLWP